MTTVERSSERSDPITPDWTSEIVEAMAKAVRLQLSRKKGFDLQARSRATNGLRAVNVARPSRWGNPHLVGYCPECWECHTREEAVSKFRDQIVASKLPYTFQALRGKNLACWCKSGELCHADVLLELANEEPEVERA